MVSIAIGHAVILTVLGLILLNSSLTSSLFGAFAQSPCSSNDRVYSVRSGDTLGVIAMRYGTTWQRLSSYNRLANPNLIYVNQHICIQGSASSSPVTFGSTADKSPGTGSYGLSPIRGLGNPFSYGQCTWWANQRYYQMHGVFVPWTINSDAWEWTARAYDFHWHVSNLPSPGAIIDFQPGVQGAHGVGHVAVVERVLGNGRVIASNMNWGIYYWQVTNVEFSAGPGVSFISYF
jgi:surface antigen